MATREQLRALDEKVVDDAIERIANELNIYSCNALLAAQGIQHWMLTEEEAAINTYCKAYKDNTWIMGMKPLWWNKLEDYSADRIQALEDFRDAIIAAKKPTIRERVSAWLASPCEIPN